MNASAANPAPPSPFRAAAVLLLGFTIILGAAYPVAVTMVAQALFAGRAGGSIATDSTGRAAGSELIGREWSGGPPAEAARWFWGRPSATAPSPYTALDLAALTGSSGSNRSAMNPDLLAAAVARYEQLVAADLAAGVPLDRSAGRATDLPVDLLTSSASGLDPHISPRAAELQVPRVARSRGLSEDAVRTLVRQATEERTLGVLGEPRVNVLLLNVALDRAHP